MNVNVPNGLREHLRILEGKTSVAYDQLAQFFQPDKSTLCVGWGVSLSKPSIGTPEGIARSENIPFS